MLKISFQKRNSLMGHTEVEILLGVDQKDSDVAPLVKVIASPYGLSVSGQVSNDRELEKLAEMVGNGWAEYLAMKPKLVTTLSGH